MADQRPADDASIPDDERLYFRIFPAADALKPVPNEPGQFMPTSGGVRPNSREEPLSVDLSSLCTPEETRDRGTDGTFHVAMITAGAVRRLGFRIARDPIAIGEAQNLAHALILGARENSDGDQVGGLTGGDCSKLAHAMRAIIVTQQPGRQAPAGD
jgi:hypothetical protein